MKMVLSAFLFGCGLALSAQVLSETPSANQLGDMAKHARQLADYPKEVDGFCHAAAIDPKKYSKDCDKAKQHLAQAQAQFDSFFDSARSEIRQKNFADAARDLSKITFGPRKDIAQALLLQLQVVGHLVPPDAVSRISFQLATAAYARGNLDEAEIWLRYIPVIIPRSPQSQLQTNIRIYRDTMQQANDLAAKHDLTGAAQKYQFAARIVPNGPGNPMELLRRIQAAQSAADHTAQQLQSPQMAVSSQSMAPSPKGKSSSEAKRKLDNRGIASRKAKDEGAQVQQTGQDQASLDRLLEQGVGQFYASRFERAADGLTMYLENGGKSHTGAAEFYLGASFAALQLVSDPKDVQRLTNFRQQAQVHFAVARRLHFLPVKGAVSPRILDIWMLSSDAQ
jgi:hypothetical protein